MTPYTTPIFSTLSKGNIWQDSHDPRGSVCRQPEHVEKAIAILLIGERRKKKKSRVTFSFHHVLAWATSTLDLLVSQPTASRMTKLGFFPTLSAFFGEILYLATFSWNRHTLLISCTLNGVSPCYWPWLYFAADLHVFCFSVERVLVFVRGAVNSLWDLSSGVWFHPALCMAD